MLGRVGAGRRQLPDYVRNRAPNLTIRIHSGKCILPGSQRNEPARVEEIAYVLGMAQVSVERRRQIQ